MLQLDNFMRQIEIIVNDTVYKYPDVYIEFTIPFDYKATPDTAEIKIYNLTNETAATFAKNTGIIINAGYQNDTGCIFVGSITDVNFDVQTNDRILVLKACQATNDYLGSVISKSYAPGTKASYIVRDMLNTIGIEIGYFQLNNDVTYLRGKTISGSIRSALNQIVIYDCNSKLYIQDGAIVIRPDGTGNNIGFLLNSDTGLIDSPSKIDKTSTDGTVTGDYNVKMLLNHYIRTDTILEIESRTANGFCRINKGKHTCTESDFLTEVEVVMI